MTGPGLKTAGIIIIGNEILSGKVQDSNSFFLVSELRALGVSVMRISVIPDDIELIGREALLFSETYDYVFTSGGVGPTHDDITMEGIANGFNAKLICHPALEERFRRRYGNAANEAIMKMAVVPEGTELIEVDGFPVISFRNIFVFPGIPELLRRKFFALKERFRSASFYLKRIFLNTEESDIAAALNAVVAEHADVVFGSYPILNNPDYKIIITAESKSEAAMLAAAGAFMSAIPEDIIFRVE